MFKSERTSMLRSIKGMGFRGFSCWWISSCLLCSRLLLVSASSGNRTFCTVSPSDPDSAAAAPSAAVRWFILLEWVALSDRFTMDLPRTPSSSLCRSLTLGWTWPDAAVGAVSVLKSHFGGLGPGLGTEPTAASPLASAFLHHSNSRPLLFLWDFFSRSVQNCSHKVYLAFRRARPTSTLVKEACHCGRASSSVRTCWMLNQASSNTASSDSATVSSITSGRGQILNENTRNLRNHFPGPFSTCPSRSPEWRGEI